MHSTLSGTQYEWKQYSWVQNLPGPVDGNGAPALARSDGFSSSISSLRLGSRDDIGGVAVDGPGADDVPGSERGSVPW